MKRLLNLNELPPARASARGRHYLSKHFMRKSILYHSNNRRIRSKIATKSVKKSIMGHAQKSWIWGTKKYVLEVQIMFWCAVRYVEYGAGEVRHLSDDVCRAQAILSSRCNDIFNPFHNLVNIHVLTRKTLRPKISKFASSTLAILFFHLKALPSSYV